MFTFNYVERTEAGIAFKTVDITEDDEIVRVEVFNTKTHKRNGDFKKWFKKIRVIMSDGRDYVGSYSTYVWNNFKSIVRGWSVKKTCDMAHKGFAERPCVNYQYTR